MRTVLWTLLFLILCAASFRGGIYYYNITTGATLRAEITNLENENSLLNTRNEVLNQQYETCNADLQVMSEDYNEMETELLALKDELESRNSADTLGTVIDLLALFGL